MFNFIRPIRALVLAAAAVGFSASVGSAATVLPIGDHGVESVADTPAVSFDMELSLDPVNWVGNSSAASNPFVALTGNWDRNQGGGPETFNLSFTDLVSGATLNATGLVYDLDFAELQFEVLFKKQSATGRFANMSDKLLAVLQFTPVQLGTYQAAGSFTGVIGAQVFQTVPASPVPLPASGLLLISGLAGAGAIARRRRV